MLMQQSEVTGCAIPSTILNNNPPGSYNTNNPVFGLCGVIDTSLCTSLASCSPLWPPGVMGLSFAKEVCLLVINQSAKPTTVSIQVGSRSGSVSVSAVHCASGNWGRCIFIALFLVHFVSSRPQFHLHQQI